MIWFDLIYEFYLQAVGYSSSSLPRGTQYNIQTEHNIIHNLQEKKKKQLTNAMYSNKTKYTLLQNKNIHYYILIKKVCHNTALRHPHTCKRGN